MRADYGVLDQVHFTNDERESVVAFQIRVKIDVISSSGGTDEMKFTTGECLVGCSFGRFVGRPPVRPSVHPSVRQPVARSGSGETNATCEL